MEESRKRILAIALEGTSKVQAMAVWDGQHLIVVELRDIKGNPEDWIEVMERDIEAKVQRGWVVMVEDRTASFSSLATSFNFDAPAEDGRTNLQRALDWYFALESRGGIILGEGMERYAIRLSGELGLIDAGTDEKGRLVYRVDWRKFNSGHKALLMCVAGAVMEEPLSERWLRVMARCSARKRNDDALAVMRTINAITRGHDRTRAMRYEMKRGALEGGCV